VIGSGIISGITAEDQGHEQGQEASAKLKAIPGSTIAIYAYSDGNGNDPDWVQGGPNQ
jgi:hypothetical protein